jgi:transcriptional antiterminator RfaH
MPVENTKEAGSLDNKSEALVWHAVYTKSRCEKKVQTLLEAKDIVVFCPIVEELHQWSDRKKKVLRPLLPGYIFVNLPQIDAAKLQVRQTPHVINFVYWLGKVAKINAAEINVLKEFCGTYQNIVIDAYVPEAKITIKEGPFKNQEAIIKKITKNKVTLYLPFLNMKLVTNKN